MTHSTMKDYLNTMARTLSHDPDTQTAAILLSVQGDVLEISANRFPKGIERTPERTQRPLKYTFIQHAERVLIAECAYAGRSTRGLTMALNWFPCSDCALLIAGAGLKAILADREKYDARKDDPRYKFAESMTILTEAGVEVKWL